MMKYALYITLSVVFILIVLRVVLYRHNNIYLSQMGDQQQRFSEFIQQIHRETWYWVWITSGHRSTEKQMELHKQNSNNAKPGHSLHEFQRAMDINLITFTGVVRKKDTKEHWLSTGVPQMGIARGFRWGGNFKSYHDPIHFDIPFEK